MTAKANFEVKLPKGDLDKLIKYLREAAREAGHAEDAIDDMMDEVKTGSRSASKELNDLNSKMDRLGRIGGNAIKGLSLAYLADKLVEIQGKIIDVTAEFEKMEAVLTTALGSRSAAQVAMAQIVNFASKTPFQVGQLTDSFVKLVNRGLQPTNKTLTALGDFTAAAGKDMDQLVEAILDVNNTERWTELGIKVKTEGNKISATFKGITVEADRTEKGALEMIKAFGEMEGIAGSMAGISETLGGKISNLDDALDRLFKTIGDAESGPMKAFVTWLIDSVDAVSDFLETDGQKSIREVAQIFDEIRQTFENSLDSADDYIQKIDDLKKSQTASAESAKVLKDRLREVEDGITQMSVAEFEELRAHFETAKNTSEALAMAITYLEKQLESLNKVAEEGKPIWDDFIVSTSGAELAALRLAVTLENAAREAFDAMKKSGTGWLDELENFLVQGVNEIEKADKDIIDANDKVVEEYKKGLDAMKAESERVKEYMKEEFWFDLGLYAVQYFNNITQAQNNASEKQIQAVERQRDYELKMAGDNKTAQAEINEEYDRKVAVLQARQARREQQAALFEIAVNTAINAVKLFAQTKPPGILSALAIGLGATQAGVVLSEPIPAFFKGVVGFNGKGTDTSDDNLVKISNNESIMTALSTRRFRRYLEAMNDPHFNEKDLHRMVLKQLPEGVVMNSAPAPDHSALRGEMKQMTREIVGAVKSKSGVNITLDGHTYSAEMIDGLNKKKYLSKKFGFKL